MAKNKQRKKKVTKPKASAVRKSVEITSLSASETARQLHKLSRSALLAFEMARLEGKSFPTRAVRNKFFDSWLTMVFKRRLYPFKEVLEHIVMLTETIGMKTAFEVKDYLLYLINHYELHASIAHTKDTDVGLYEHLELAFTDLKESGLKVSVAASLDNDKSMYEPGCDNEVFTLEGDHKRAVKGNDIIERLPVYIVGNCYQQFIDACYKQGIIPMLLNESKGDDVESYRFMVYPMNFSSDSPINIPSCRYVLPTNFIPKESRA